jgi:hypothetical protein
MPRTNAQRDEAIDAALARIAQLESILDGAEVLVDDEPPEKKQPAIPPNSQKVERIRLRSGKVVSRVVQKP